MTCCAAGAVPLGTATSPTGVMGRLERSAKPLSTMS